MKRSKKFRDIAYFVSILILVLALVFGGLRILESTFLHRGDNRGDDIISKTIIRDGIEYFPRQDITTVLVMGIDKYRSEEESDYDTNTGTSDMNMLLIFDEANAVINVLHLNRDTMLEMPVLGSGGKVEGICYGQLALSHTYGTGLQDSSENTRNAVSNFLYGIRIDDYISLRMDAIAILNDVVGGVTVAVEEDFSHVDPTIPVGTVTLTGEQALNYVRTGKDLGDPLNSSRIARHKQYMDGFLKAIRAKQTMGIDFVLDAYQQIRQHMVTDCSVNAFIDLIKDLGSYRVNEVVTPEGETVLGEKGYEFYVDEEKLDALILRLFYRPKG